MNELALMVRMPKMLSADEYYALADRGEIDEDSAIELVDGELVPMAPKYNAHEVAKRTLMEWLVKRLDEHWCVAAETSVRLSDTTVVEPDLVVYARSLLPQSVRGADLGLAIEIADSSLSYDVKVKAPIYARHGVREFWILNAPKRQLLVYREPGTGGYAFVAVNEAGDPVIPLVLPGTEFRVNDLKWPMGPWDWN